MGEGESEGGGEDEGEEGEAGGARRYGHRARVCTARTNQAGVTRAGNSNKAATLTAWRILNGVVHPNALVFVLHDEARAELFWGTAE